ncbi:hypothetical protein SAMN05421642_11385 [Rhodococcoides kyotonense]|uniref:Uncharacterized protein n=2 Tax=Rhodococcoides kyotonense TaxID=398843 RepID=A0A239LIT7_9NOCA|nr:hypothetical protein SAMN05421642_11385 [Rhodococcus kyotonensis]
MVILVVMLFVSVFIQAGTSGWCLQSSISAYYFTDVHAIFIAVLCASGALLIVYKGNSDTEDVLYDFAGFWAFFVATVPSGWPTNLGVDGRVRGLCGGSGLPLVYDAGQAIGNNVSVVFVGVLLVLLASILFVPGPFGVSWTVLGTLVRVVGVLITGVLAIGFVYAPHWFERHGHSWAAIPFFGFVILAVWVNAFLATVDPATSTRYVTAYRIIGVSMVATLILVLVLSMTVRWTLFVLFAEAALLLEFALFWVVQTAELWKTGCRDTKFPAFVM